MRAQLVVLAAGVFACAACALVADIESVSYQSAASDAAPARDADADGDGDGEGDGATSAEAGGDPCDRDGDGSRSNSPQCAGDDCNDDDPRIHPGAGFTADPPVPGNDGDWNCDGRVEKESGIFTGCGTPPVCGGGGMTNAIGCGQKGDFVVCADISGSCSPTGTEPRTQACR